MMKSKEFINKLVDIATNYKTLYIMGCFGAPMTMTNKARYTANHAYNMAADRKAMINAASSDTFGFDCVCLIKGVLWGWTGDASRVYGGAGYCVNGVPDIDAKAMINVCNPSTTGWGNLTPGEAVWMEGHIGVYIGDNLVVECSPKWQNKVQITALGNNGGKSGYNSRVWTKHGKLPYVDYTDQEDASYIPTVPGGSKTVEQLAQEVLDGVWGNGDERKAKLTAAGYDYQAVQTRVNEIVSGASKTVEQLAQEVLDGVWGNGQERKDKLEAAGYDYQAVQTAVNALYAGQTSVASRKVTVTASIGLNCRKEPNTSSAVVKAYPYGTTLTITKEQSGWGYTGDGWVSLEYVK